MSMDPAFSEYVVARSATLLRTAYLLTGNRADAEDLLQTTLAKTYLAWDRIRDREKVDGYVRRTMVNTQTSFWRRHRPEALYDDLPERPGRDAHADSDLHDALWSALGRLGRKQRAIVVLTASHWMKPIRKACPGASTRVPPATESLPQKNDALVPACSSMPWPHPLAQSEGCGGSGQSR